MIESEYKNYTLKCTGDKVELNEVEGKFGYMANFDTVKLLRELGVCEAAQQAMLNIGQREWNAIADTQIRYVKEALKKLDQNSYRQQDVDDIDCKLAALIKRIDSIQIGGLKNLAGRVDGAETNIKELQTLLQSGREVTVHSRLSDMEENLNELRSRFARLEGWQVVSKKIADLERCTLQMAKTIDANSENVSSNVAEDRRRLTRLEESNEQRKKDIKHAWNVCDDMKKEMDIIKTNSKSVGDALNTHMTKCQGGECDRARFSVCSKKLDKMEECCRNTVAAGKELERKVDNIATSQENQSARLDNHNSRLVDQEKKAARAQKFMDKLHDL